MSTFRENAAVGNPNRGAFSPVFFPSQLLPQKKKKKRKGNEGDFNSFECLIFRISDVKNDAEGNRFLKVKVPSLA